MKIAKRKLYLQYLQLKYLKGCQNKSRKFEQMKVMMMLIFNPHFLFTGKMLDTNENWLYKYVNSLTSNSKNDRLYVSAKKMLQLK